MMKKSIVPTLWVAAIMSFGSLVQAQIPTTLGWYQIPNTQFMTVQQTVWPGAGNPAMVIAAWGGGTYDSKRNRLIVWGGGHGDYSGNEVYVLDLNANPIAPLRLNNPDQYAQNGTCHSPYQPGSSNPSSRHTYQTLAYLPTQDKMVNFGGGEVDSGCFGTDTWWFDPGSLAWTLKVANGMTGVCDYDPNKNIVHCFNDGIGSLFDYNPATNSSSETSPETGGFPSLALSGVVDPDGRRFYIVGGGYMGYYDISGTSPYPARVDVAGTNCTTFKSADNWPGLQYDPVQKLLVEWHGGDTVNTYNPATNSCSSVTFSGGPPSPAGTRSDGTPYPPGSQQQHGTFGRFRYVPSQNAFILVNDWAQNAFILRLTNGTPPPPPVITSAGSPTGTVGSAFSYQITATNNPTSFNAAGLPAGLSINTNTGLISGTPTVAATSSVTLSATNSGGAGSATLTLTINASGGIPPTLGWTQLPNTQLQTVCPPASQYPNIQAIEGCSAVIADWSGGVADTKRNRLIVWGGGHNGYLGNEVYALNLAANPITLTRLNNPTDLPGGYGGCSDAYPDGKPASRHTYTGISYAANVDAMVAIGGSLSVCGGFSEDAWSLDLSALSWTHKLQNIGFYQFNPFSAYEPNSGLVFFNDGAQLWTYNPNTNAVTTVDTFAGGIQNLGYPNLVVDPADKLLFLIGDGNFFKWNIAGSPPYTRQDISGTVTGCSALFQGGGGHGLGAAWDPMQKVIVGWSGGDSVTLFNPLTNSCSSVTYPGGPGAQQPNGTYGRFDYFPALGIFALVNDWQQNAYILRLTNGTPPPPSPAPVITSAGSATGTVGSAFSYQITATNSPTSFNATGLPAGLSVNTNTGLISGTPTTAATSSAGLSATNAGGTGNATLTLTINASGGSPDADFAARCAAPGVLNCQGFDDPNLFNTLAWIPTAGR